jgi:hypothetical protein
MAAETIVSTYHVLLVGIDRYPSGYNSLGGCVNDIDAIERLLLEPPGIGVPPEQIRVTRLAAARGDQMSASRFRTETLPPTKANLVQALTALAGPEIQPSDRVLIYYAGHGDQKRWTSGSLVWHEALVPQDGHEVEYLFDVELNALITAISARTSDLTIVLDACHSAGATRDLHDIQAQGAVRALDSDDSPVAPPVAAAPGRKGYAALDRGVGSQLLQSPEPSYLVVVGCQSHETCKEGAYPSGEPSHGVFTHSLLSVLRERDATQRAGLRWADIWPALLARVAERNALLHQRAQHPWMIGRSERKVFGGPWDRMDVGYSVTQQPDGGYDIGAGRLLGVTEGAEIGVYGTEPRRFPPVGSANDRPVGRLIVSHAGPSSAVATAAGHPFALPEGARSRLLRPGEGQRLRVSLKPPDPAAESQLAESPLIELVSSTDSDADVEVIARPDDGWIIGNEIEPVLAIVPPGEIKALCAGLESYYRYNAVLRMARHCNNPQLSNSLRVHILDCTDGPGLTAMSRNDLADPALPEAPRDADRIYRLPSGFAFCVKVANNSSYPLNVTLLNCSAAGTIEYLSDALLRDRSAHVMWLDNTLGRPFEAGADELPAVTSDGSLPTYTTERMIAIGTTRPDVDLRFLTLDDRVQDVVEAHLSTSGSRILRPAPGRNSVVSSELWTAAVIPIRVARQ